MIPSKRKHETTYDERCATRVKRFDWLLLATLSLPAATLPLPAATITVTAAKGDGTTDDTRAIQQALDVAAGKHDIVTLRPGTYLVGSLFVKSATRFDLPRGVTLRGIQKLEAYPLMPTRVAGIEMTWPAALVNVYKQTDVQITGEGTIDGDGSYWWKSYWDLRAAYEPRGLRWASDYDAKRPRLIQIFDSSNVRLDGPLLTRSGFWTVHICYSHDVTVDHIAIRNNEGGKGPSTDGIDIDSSKKILVQHADIDVNDDALCLKAGRDADGLRVHRPTENIILRDSIIRSGAAAVTIGSETSGGFRNIEAYNLTALSGVPSGVLFKSAHTRGGFARDIRIHDLTLTGVAIPIHITMNWNPSYSYATLPPGEKDVPAYWKVLTTPVPAAQGLPHFSDVHIWNIHATGAKSAFEVSAYPEAPLQNFTVDHLDIAAATAGRISNAQGWTLEHNTIRTADGSSIALNTETNHELDVPFGEPK